MKENIVDKVNSYHATKQRGHAAVWGVFWLLFVMFAFPALLWVTGQYMRWLFGV